MTEALDASLGRIFGELERLELLDETLVIFTSDNGPYLGVAEPKPLREGKGYLYEGGIRVPLLISYPGKIEPGVSDTPVVSMDFYPTILEATGLTRSAEEAPTVRASGRSCPRVRSSNARRSTSTIRATPSTEQPTRWSDPLGAPQADRELR